MQCNASFALIEPLLFQEAELSLPVVTNDECVHAVLVHVALLLASLSSETGMPAWRKVSRSCMRATGGRSRACCC